MLLYDMQKMSKRPHEKRHENVNGLATTLRLTDSIHSRLNCAPCCRFVLFCYERDFMLSLSVNNQTDTIKSKIYDKRDDFNFEIVNFPFLDGDVPCSPSYGVYFSQLIRFARVRSNVDNFNNRNLFLTAKLLKQG